MSNIHVDHAASAQSVEPGARRHLVKARAAPKRNVKFVGYWKKGKSS